MVKNICEVNPQTHIVAMSAITDHSDGKTIGSRVTIMPMTDAKVHRSAKADTKCNGWARLPIARMLVSNMVVNMMLKLSEKDHSQAPVPPITPNKATLKLGGAFSKRVTHDANVSLTQLP